MPEGHTIHRIARDHRKRFGGRPVSTSSPQGRFADGSKLLDGRVLSDVDAHGKHLFYHWDDDQLVLHVHLGLYGKFRNHKSPPPEPRGAVRLRVVNEQHAFDLNGPTACEVISAEQRAAFSQRLGPDPLRRDADPEQVWSRMHRSRAAIGKLLLDQSVIAGIGNVYRAEVLYLTRIHPTRAGNTLTRQEFDDMWSRICELLRIGVKYNRIITADPGEVGRTRGRMRRAERLLVYKKERCGQCDAPVRSWELGARRMYACDRCQG